MQSISKLKMETIKGKNGLDGGEEQRKGGEGEGKK